MKIDASQIANINTAVAQIIAAINNTDARVDGINGTTVLTPAISGVSGSDIATQLAYIWSHSLHTTGGTTTGDIVAPNFQGKLNGAYYSVSSVQPVSPSTNDIWFDVTNRIIKYYNGSSWTTMGSTSSTGGTSTSASSTPQWANVITFGAKGDGVTDDTAAINRAIDYLYNSSGGVVYFPNSTPGYVVKRRIPNSQTGSILVKPGISLLGDNATILMRNNATFMTITGDCGNPNWLATGYFPDVEPSPSIRPSVFATITTDISYGATSLTVDTIAGFAVGDVIGMRVGDNPYDNNETNYFDMATIKTIVGTVITIDRPIGTNLTVSTNTSKNRKIFKILKLARNQYIKGFTLINDIPNGGVAEAGISFQFCENIQIEDIIGFDPGAALIGGNYSRNISIKNVAVKSSIQQNGHPAKGRCIGFYNLTNLFIDNLSCENFQATALFLESYCREVRVKNIRIINNFPGRSNAIGIFTLGQSSELMIEDVRIDGYGSLLYDIGSTNDNFCNIHNLVLNTNTVSPFSPADVTGVLKIYDSHGNYDIFDMADRRQACIRIDLRDGMVNEVYRAPEGLIAYYAIYASDNLVTGDLASLFVGRDNFYMNGTDIASQLAAGKETFFYSGLDTSIGKSLQVPMKVQVSTAKTGQSGKFIYVTIDYIPSKRRRNTGVSNKTWFPNSPYAVGSSISHPTNANFECYVALAGTTGAIQPNFLATDGASVTDGTVTWLMRKLTTSGTDYLNANASWNGYLPAVSVLPAASSQFRRKVLMLESGSGKVDSIYTCVKLADDTYSWIKLF